MWTLFVKTLSDHWKPSSLAILALGFVWLGFKTNDFTIEMLDPFFFSEAQAQGLEKRIGALETKVDDLAGTIDDREAARIEGDIFKLRVDSCMLPAGELRASYENQIAKLITQWRLVTRQANGTPPVPSCRDLGQG